MRRKISLYIGGELADLDDQSFIFFNYTMEDLSNPTIVKNSFSQQITLKGTPNNNRIFGDLFRLDRSVDFNSSETGTGFNPSRKTPFSIYNDTSEVLESGYCKLDEVVRNGADVQYKVSLYGGLGSFLFALSYDEAGNKRTLADLDFLGTGDPGELDFTINAATLQDAWDDLYSKFTGGSPSGKWTVINFAPAYNGYPDNFSPDKGIISLPGAGLPDSVNGYHSKNGYGLVNLANKQDEWAVKDIRSYLQRPVLSVKAFLDAVCDPDNNGGYTVDISQLSGLLMYYDLWVTLPTIPSLGSMKQSTGGLSVTMSSSATTGNEIGRFDVSGTVPYGAVVNATLRAKVRFNMPSGANTHVTLYLSGSNGTGSVNSTVLFMQMVAYASDGTVMGGSGVRMAGGNERAARYAAEACGFSPVFPTDDFQWVDAGNAIKISSGVFELQNAVTFNVEAQDVSYFKLMCYVYDCQSTLARGVWQHNYSGTGSTSRATLYASYSTYYQATTAFIVSGGSNEITKTDPDTLRSGAFVTKRMLLSTSATPADYLLSFCKIFGLHMITDTAEKKVTIVTRNGLYIDETVDITKRVDLSKEITIVPLAFDSKWYRFSLEGVGGAFFNEYRDIEGIDYGIQMIDTGFDFNADVKDLLDTNVYRNAVSVLQRSRYWNIIKSGATFMPSPFLDTGNTVTRWNDAGETQDTAISCPPASASVTYYNNEFNGYDMPMNFKAQFADADGKQVDGKDVLLFLNRFDEYPSFKITDDLPVMSAVNDGKPCWILDEGPGLFIPCFSRYDCRTRSAKYIVYRSMDFGVPRQLDIPSVVYESDATLYAVAWRSYLADRYDVDTRVMKCRVHLDGLQVNHGLLRKFYWFDNSLWVLNKIVNYSLTTYDPVECEFIKVKDKNDYLTGQDY